jgi:integrase
VAMFRFHYPNLQLPFAGVTVGRAKGDAARRRQLVAQGRARELIPKRVYTPDEIYRQILTARFIDLHPEVGLVADWASRTLAPTAAAQLCFASRIAELCEVRWHDVDEDDGFILIPGTKSDSAIRYIPLQNSMRPWLTILREAQTPPRLPTHHILRMHPAQDAKPVKDVWARRMGMIQRVAGLKIEGQRSHIYRRTHTSIATMAGVAPYEIKLLLGHSNVMGGATDDYVQMIHQLTRPEHRTYIMLPTPEEVDEVLAGGWTPPNLPKRNSRR